MHLVAGFPRVRAPLARAGEDPSVPRFWEEGGMVPAISNTNVYIFPSSRVYFEVRVISKCTPRLFSCR